MLITYERYVDFRVSILPTIYGETAVIRILDKLSLSLDMGNIGTGLGPEVYEVTATKDDLVNLIDNKVSELLNQDVSPGAITILSSLPLKDSIVSLLSSRITGSIVELDEYGVRNFPLTNISFSEIKNFKGLENEVILLVDLAPPSSLSDGDNKTLHYVGMSRARGLLCAFWEDKA